MLAAVAAGASLAGTLWREVYRDPETFIFAGWLGNDLATLLVAVPVLVWATAAAARGSPRGRLVWLGALDYMLYNYAFYLFGAVPNRLLLAYILIVALALLALLIGLANLDVAHPRISGSARRFTMLYMVAWGVALLLLWAIQAGRGALTGEAPDLNGSVHAFRVTAALDLTLVVPYVLMASLLLARNAAWAVPVAAIVNVKGVLYPLALVASSWTAHQAGVEGALALVPLWVGFMAASGAATWLLLRRMA